MGDKVFINGRAAVHKGSKGKARAFPDVCLCPPAPPAGPVPTPLTNTVEAKDLAGGARTVLIEGNPAGKMSSYFARSTGNEVSRPTGGGVASHAVQGKAYFVTYSPNVFIEGEPAVRHLDLLTQNHLGKGAANTPPSVWLSAMDTPPPGNPPKSRSMTASEGTDWIEILLVDETGEPVPGTSFVLKTAKGKVLDGRLLGGGSLRVTRLAKGRCRLAFPDMDEAGGNSKRRETKSEVPGAVVYKPAKPLLLDTGKTHRIVVFGTKTLWITLPMRVRDVATRDDVFILRSDDDTYRETMTMANDCSRGEKGLILSFSGLFKGPNYTLEHRRQAIGRTRTIFADRSFADLFPAKPPKKVIDPERIELMHHPEIGTQPSPIDSGDPSDENLPFALFER